MIITKAVARKFFIFVLSITLFGLVAIPAKANFNSWSGVDLSRTWGQLYVSEDGSLMASLADRIYVSSNSGSSWVAKGPDPKSWTAISGTRDGSFLIASAGTEIFSSVDRGETWNLISTLSVALDRLDVSDRGSQIIGSVQGGKLWRSTNSGASWTDFDTARSWSDVAVTGDGMTIYASVSSGAGLGIYKGGFTQTNLTPLSYINPDNAADMFANSWYAMDLSSDGTVLIASTQSDVFISEDSGSTFIDIGTVSEAFTKIIRDVALSSDGSRILVSESRSAGGNGSIQYSVKSGTTRNFRLVENVGTGDLLNAKLSGNGSKALVAQNPGLLYISTFSSGSSGSAGSGSSAPALAPVSITNVKAKPKVNQISRSSDKVVTRNQIRKKMGISPKRNITYKIVGKNSKVCSLDKSGFYAKKVGRCQIQVITNWKSGKTQVKVFSIRFTD